MPISKAKPRGLLVIAAGTAGALAACGHNEPVGFYITAVDGGRDAGASCEPCGPVGVVISPLDGGPDAGPDAAAGCANDSCGLVALPIDAGSDAEPDDASDATSANNDADAAEDAPDQ